MKEGRMKGYMIKEGKFFKTWRKRWFVLGSKELAYYKSEEDADPLNSFWLDSTCRISLESHRQHNLCFKLETKDRTLYFVADSESLYDWVKAFCSHESQLETNFLALEKPTILPQHEAVVAKQEPKSQRTDRVRTIPITNFSTQGSVVSNNASPAVREAAQRLFDHKLY